MRLFIESNDVLMFRDGRPFSGGEDHFARCIFPPSPATIYGAIRSRILSERWEEYDEFKKGTSEDLNVEIGTPDTNGTLAITGFGLAMRNEGMVAPLFPIPRDTVKIKGNNGGDMFLLKPEPEIKGITKTNLPEFLDYLWIAREDALEDAVGFLTVEEVERYLLGEPPKVLIPPEKLFQHEERTGIRKSKSTKSVDPKEGGLYSVEYVRMNQDTGFFLEMVGTSLLPSTGILRLGGDYRTARYKEASWDLPEIPQIKKRISETKRFKLFLTTPAIFKKGWLPGSFDEITLKGSINEIEMQMIGAALGRPAGIGGFDLVKGRPKMMEKGVPAGSVYFFEMTESNVDKLFDRLWLQPVSDERQHEGFGISMIGTW